MSVNTIHKTDSPPHGNDNVEEKEPVNTDDPFQIDTSLIPQAAFDDQELELQNMGLSVFNQYDLEQGIMTQVDRALAKEEEVRYRKILQKELKTIDDDITFAKADLKHVRNLEDRLENPSNSHQQILSMQKQKENKLKQLKTLKTRRENVTKKLQMLTNGSQSAEEGRNEENNSTFDQAFRVGVRGESEAERLIRTGNMTPFGTVVKPTLPGAKRGEDTASCMSDFEKSLMAKQPSLQRAQQSFNRYLKKKSEQATSHSSDSTENVAEGCMQRKSQRTVSKVKDSINDSQLLDNSMRDEDETVDVSDDTEDDYHPSQEESTEDDYSENSESGNEVKLCKRKRQRSSHSGIRKKPRPLPKYRESVDDDDHVRARVKRDRSIRQERDDADPEFYQKRLYKAQKKEKKETEDSSLASSGDEDHDKESEFDGGFQVPKKLWKKLFPYQKTGVRWLWELHCQQAGGIIGDEMGLGKTIQTIAFLAALKTSRVKNVNFPYKGLGPTIVVCPATVMHQWLKEFHKWWPDFRVAILHSSGSFSGSESDLVRSIAKSQGILITSYNTLVVHQELVLRFNWHYVVLDEGHKIRNPDAKVTICCKQFRTPHRIILSGSPIQNNLKELWSLFDFVFPGKLGTLPDFMQHFSIPIIQGGYSNATQVQVETAYRCACVLRDTINPYLIRRMKADVKKGLDLPNKNEQVLFCRLTDEQREVYQEYLDSRQCRDILQGKFQVFAGLITLRKICNHPDLSTGGPQVFKGQGPSNDPEYQFGYHKRSGKMIVVEALLRLWYKQKHRVLLFTQSKTMLNILEKFAQDQGYSYLVMDGGTSISSRQPLISQYNNDPSIYLFLLTTRVGGLGVNLTGADRVIIYDPDWNPSTDIQARERAWRIGQTRQVTIYRLLTSGTIEEKIYHRQIFKQFLTNRILKDPKQRRLFKSQDMMELFTLGSKDNKEGTETSALFAGTGSDVKIPKRRKRNRFDEILEQQEKAKKQIAEKGDSVCSDQEESMDLDELERMKELARRLSRQMEENKRKKQEEKKDKISTDDAPSSWIDRSKDGAHQHSSKTNENAYDWNGEVEEDNPPSTSQLAEEHMKLQTNVTKCPNKEEWSEKDSYTEVSNKEDFNTNDSNKKDSNREDSNKEVWNKKDFNWEDSNKKESSREDSNKEDRNKQDFNRVDSNKEDCNREDSNKKDSNKEDPHMEGPNDQRHKWQRNGKLWTIPMLKSRKSFETKDGEGSQGEDKMENNKAPASKVHRSVKLSSDDNVKLSDEEHTSRGTKGKVKKRKHHNARFEGERIPHLVKHCPLAEKKETDELTSCSKEHRPKQDSHEDDYVLHQLFKKTGIQGAMKHDKIMDSGRPDYAIVEAEAEKVAREAAAALRRSRQLCSSAMSGLPSWTGQNGGLAKPRFGQKTNSLLGTKSKIETSSSASSDNLKTSNEAQDKNKLFDGSISGNVSLSSRNDTLTSNYLLSRMKARKRISTVRMSEEDDDFLRPDQPQTLDKQDEELLEDIRSYVAFMGNTNGEATTEEIVLNFGKRLPKSDAPKFKAMLNQICDFHGGIWKLKAEFR